jgi:threonylcarbamoyladenosine tRNA methylthiotransferase MtaB
MRHHGFEIAGPAVNPDARSSDVGAAGEVDSPDVVVVNTCTVTRESSRSSRQLITRAVRQHPHATVVVTGCYAVAEPDVVAAIPGVDVVVANKDKDTLAGRVASLFPGAGLPGAAGAGAPTGAPDPDSGLGSRSVAVPVAIRPRRAEVRSSLKVQTGCDEQCTFCIVPTTRGALASVAGDRIVARARDLVDRGAREIVVTGVHLARYGIDLASDLGVGLDLGSTGPGAGRPSPLVDVLERLLALDGLVRVRLSSIEAAHLPDAVLDLMRDEPRLAPHLHLPLQSASPSVFERMRRPGTLERHVAVAERALAEIPGLALTTDVLVGFPGETDEDFALTVALIERLRYSKLHVFRFSAREGTPAEAMADQVGSDRSKERAALVRDAGDRLRRDFIADRCREGPLEVLVEQITPGPDGPRLRGTTGSFVRVDTTGPAGLVGQMVRVAADASTITADGVSGSLVEPRVEQRVDHGDVLDGDGRPVEYAAHR